MIMIGERGEIQQRAPHRDLLAREKMFLAEQATEGGIKVVPGQSWAFHYPQSAEIRSAAIKGLLSGQFKPDEVADFLKPDAFTYDVVDLEQQGLQAVVGRVRDVSSYVAHYDYHRFAQFVSDMQGTGESSDIVRALYDSITQSRIRKKMIDSYGFTGRQQLEGMSRAEAASIAEQMASLSQIEKVLEALKMNWFTEDLRVASTEQRDQVLGQLSADEHQLFNRLNESYQNYVRRGDQAAYQRLVDGVKENIVRNRQVAEEARQQIDESQKQLERELEQYMDRAVPPGTPGDLAISQEDSDEYHTPPVNPGESKEQAASKPFFVINPSGMSTKPLTGYYISGRKSYYDIGSKTWSKRKRLSPYDATISGEQRQTISGATSAGIKSIPIPNGYGLDTSSLKFTGAEPEILRDQNGCFYIRTNGNCLFSVDFLKQEPAFVGFPVDDDKQPIYQGLLSDQTEQQMADAVGGTLEKAEQLRRYLLSKHFYPGDGDLQMAQALQLKLRSESTGDNYIQNLDRSEYLECYSANTLFVAMLRKVGIPARLIVGHRPERAKDGKVAIDSTTGHAWAEVWDGNAWRRMDATPQPRQQKDKDNNEEGQSSPSEEAQDDGIERRDQNQSDQQQGQGEPQEDQSQQSQDGQSGNQTKGKDAQQMGEASDQDIAQGESQLENARQVSQQMSQQKTTMDQQLQNAQSFKDLKNLVEKIEDSELFDDQKQDLQQKLDAKEEQMKKAIQDELDQMMQDGFIDDDRMEELEDQLDAKNLEELDRIRQQIERESSLFNEYQSIKEEIMPLVDQWFEYFIERLPKQEEVELDEDSLTRQGAFNRRSVMRQRNLLFGTVKNPRQIRPSVKPMFLASVMVDVSGSMGKGGKLLMARKLLVFYNELFSRINSEFGYIRYANTIFSDDVVEIKTYDQEYESSARYDWGDGTQSTIKARLMQKLRTQGGTNMLPAIQRAAAALNAETFEYPEYASAMYFIGDGQDTSGNSKKITQFLRLTEEEQGFGNHMLSAIMLGKESQRRELAEIFGDDHTTVAPDFETLIERSMEKFNEDIETYLADKTV